MRKILSFFMVAVMLFSFFQNNVCADVGDNNFRENESNNTRDIADLIYNNYTVSGELTAYDIDCYEFTLTATTTVLFTCVSDYSSLLLGVYDSNDNVVAVGTQESTSSKFTSTYFKKTLPAGTYCVVFVDSQTTYVNSYMFYMCYTMSATGDCVWSLDGTVLTISGEGEMEDHDTWNDEFDTYSPWGKNITEVIIKEGVTYIGAAAFDGCSKLTTVTIPDSVTSIGWAAFSGCTNLNSITIGNNVTDLGSQVFENCSNLTNVTIGKKIKTIGEFSFAACDNLTSITIPESVTTIEYGAFLDCPNLKNIYYCGSKSQVNNIEIDEFNDELIGSNWHYDSCIMSDTHTYSGECDTVCNVCCESRTVSVMHSYCSDCDENCEVCLMPRDTVVDHVYTNLCDTSCNVCKSNRTITHDFKWVIDEDASCGINGLKHEECTICSKKRNEGTKINATGKHTYRTTTTPATCTKEGVKTFTCGICNKTKTETIKVIAHTSVDLKAVAATCSAPGKTAGKKCSVCNTVTVAQTEVKALGHKEVVLAAKAATYTTTGLTEGKKCSVCGIVTVAQKTVAVLEKASLKSAKVTVKDQTYSGKAKKPAVTVTLNGKKLVKGVDFTVSYKNNKKVGKATVTITGIGAYKDSVFKTFIINPAPTKISKVTAGKKSLKVKVAKKTKEVTGYEIQYSTSKKFKSAKKVTIKKAKTTSVTIKKLKSKKTYYLRVRTFKTVKGKKYYSGWSTIKFKKTK